MARKPDNLSLVSRPHGRRGEPTPKSRPLDSTHGPWHPNITHTNHKLFLKVISVPGEQQPCLHTYKHAHTHARQIHGNREKEGQEMGRRKVKAIEKHINVCVSLDT